MNDQKKTKAQLIAELEETRQRLSEWQQDASSLRLRRAWTESPESEGAHLIDEADQVIGLVGVSRDVINERVRAEDALRASEARYRELFDNIRSGVAVYEASGDGGDFFIRNINKAGERISRVRKEEIIGKSVLEVFPGVKEMGLFDVFQQVWRSGEPQHIPIRLYQDDRLSHWVENYVYKLPSGEIIAVYDDVTEQVRAEAALRESEAKYRELVQSANSIIFRMDTQGRVTFFNEFAQSFFGYSEEEILGQNVVGTIVPDEASSGRDLASMIQDIVQHPERYANNENENMRRNGERVWVAWTNKAIRDDQNRPKEILCIGNDITQRVRAEQALAHERDLLHALMDHIPDTIYFKDTASRFVRINRAQAQVLGVTDPEQAIGKTDFDFLSPELARGSYADEQEIVKSGQPLTGKVERIMGAGGSYRWLSTTKVPITDERGRVTGIVGVSRDITDRVQAEKRVAGLNRLKEDLLTPGGLNEKLKRVTDGVVEIFGADFARIWIIRPGDRCDAGCIHAEVAEGSRACRHREQCLHLMAGSGRYTHIDGQIHQRVPLGWYKIGRIAAGDSPKLITNHVTTDPEVYDRDWARKLGLVSFAGYRLNSPAGEPIGVLALFSQHAISPDEDALLETVAGATAQVIQTVRAEEALKEHSEHLEEMVEERTRELRDAQDRLLRRGKMAVLGRLAGGVAHELRTPLGAIRNAAYLIRLALEETEPEIQEGLAILEREVKTSERIISSLLDFARTRVPVRQEVGINAVVREALSRIEVPDQVKVISHLDQALPAIQADPDQLEQVFGNLFLNAIQAMPEGGRLSVISEQLSADGRSCPNSGGRIENPPYGSDELPITDNWILITVKDTGVGIPPENLDKLFEPLFTTRAKGIGLGLALVEALVEGHGGSIGVESEVGKGSTFTVKLPLGVEEGIR